MTRTGHARARRAVRDHRIFAVAAVVMFLLALGASVLVSAGSSHHAQPMAAGITIMGSEPGGAQPASGHDHKHGNEWAPTFGKRLRLAATAALLGIAAARPHAPGAARDAAACPVFTGPGERLISLSVLRV